MKAKSSELRNPWAILAAGTVVLWLIRSTATSPVGRYQTSLPLAGIVAFFVALTSHELGHALAGLLIKFKFVAFAVGPVALLSTPRGIRLRLFDNRSHLLGFNLFLPRDDVKLRQACDPAR